MKAALMLYIHSERDGSCKRQRVIRSRISSLFYQVDLYLLHPLLLVYYPCIP
jgi:hypothetical protein